MAVNTALVTPVGSGRIYQSEDGRMKFMFVEVVLAASVTYDTSLRADLSNFKNLYTFNMGDAVAGELGKGVKIKQVLWCNPISLIATPTGQVKAQWLGLKNFQFSLSIIGTNGNTATTGPKDEVELGAVSTGSPAGNARAIVFF